MIKGVGCMVRRGKDACGFEIVDGLFQPFPRFFVAYLIRIHKRTRPSRTTVAGNDALTHAAYCSKSVRRHGPRANCRSFEMGRSMN